ncbi:MAG: hypothetical protein ACK5LJ_13235 [Paracoccus sp. (in: a-proteobacteria)]
MPRTHGYAPRGRRCYGVRDWHARGRINVLGALLSGVLLTVGLTTSNVDAFVGKTIHRIVFPEERKLSQTRRHKGDDRECRTRP